MWGGDVILRSAFFYAENGLIASTDNEWLQGASDTLTGFFNGVGLHTNI